MKLDRLRLAPMRMGRGARRLPAAAGRALPVLATLPALPARSGRMGAGLTASLALALSSAVATAQPLLPEQIYQAGRRPSAVAAADIDGDEIPDLVAADRNGTTVYLLRGKGDGTFEKAVPAGEVGQSPIALALADLDGDGAMDLVTANGGLVAPAGPDVIGPGDLSVALGEGDGSFGPAATLLEDATPRQVEVADFNNDQIPDLVTINSGSQDGTVLLGNGDGTFQAPLPFLESEFPASLAVGDVDGDGVVDLATGGRVLLGRGDGTFALGGAIASPALSLADFDGDDALDLVSAILTNPVSTPGIVAVYPGNGDGSFEPAIETAAGLNPAWNGAIATADLDGDGALDLVASDHVVVSEEPQSFPVGRVLVLLGNGDGSFQPGVFLPTGSFLAPWEVALADLDGDEALDLVVASFTVPGPGNVGVTLGNGDGSFRARIPFAVGGTDGIVQSDVDNNGVPDVVTVGFGPSTPGVFVRTRAVWSILGTGDGRFEDPILSPGGYGVSSLRGPLAVADLDRNGRVDVVAADFRGLDGAVLRGLGDGRFTLEPDSGEVPVGPIGTADFDGDTLPDLFSRYATFRGNGDLTFQEGVSMGQGLGVVEDIQTADLDGDGAPDLVTRDRGVGLRVILGNGDGTFQPAATYPGEFLRAFAIGDVDADGVLDLAAAYGARFPFRDTGMTVYLGNGDGGFQDPVDTPVMNFSPFILAIADLDGDGPAEVLATVADGLAVLRGRGDATLDEPIFYAADPGSTIAVVDLDEDCAPDVMTGSRNSQEVYLLTNSRSTGGPAATSCPEPEAWALQAVAAAALFAVRRRAR